MADHHDIALKIPVTCGQIPQPAFECGPSHNVTRMLSTSAEFADAGVVDTEFRRVYFESVTFGSRMSDATVHSIWTAEKHA